MTAPDQPTPPQPTSIDASAVPAIDTVTTIPALTVVSAPDRIDHYPFVVKRQKRPFTIFAALLDCALGEFLNCSYFAAAVKLNHGNARLTVYYRTDRPYKDDALAINPYVDRVVKIAGPSVLPIELFYESYDRFHVEQSTNFIRAGHASPDLILTKSMMLTHDLPRFEHYPVFAIPEARRAQVEARLVESGLDPTRWYCCLYYRQGNYKYRGGANYRDVDDKPFEALTAWIIEKLGGQVVRIGHPEMRPFPARPGFVDLSRLENDFLLQAAAMARARFMITTMSGPASVPGMFGVPFAATNAVGILGCWSHDHLLLPRHIFRPDGRRIPLERLLKSGEWNEGHVRYFYRKGCKLIDNSIDELREITLMLHAQTADTTTWRPPPQMKVIAGDLEYVTPRHYRNNIKIVQFPALTPQIP